MTDQQEKQRVKKLKLKIEGMHCGNCDLLIERSFKKIAGVRRVDANYATGRAEVFYSSDLDIEMLQAAVAEEGYGISLWSERGEALVRHSGNGGRDYLEIGAAFLVLVGLFLMLKQFDVLPQSFGISDNMSYGLVFVIGLVASVSTCIAVTGGLLVAVAAKYNDANPQLSGVQRFRPHIYFNAGRIVSYTLLGGAVGALGSALTLSPAVNGLLTIAASAIMILLGLQMLRLLPSLGRFQPRMPKALGHRIHDLAAKETNDGAFILGASTFFLPCGFTQALQLYVLSKGSFTIGALTMLAFAVGTLPALLSLSAVSSFAKGAFQKHFLKVAGAAVVLLGIFSLESGLVLTNTGLSAASATTGREAVSPSKSQPTPTVAEQPIATEKQIVEMRVAGLRYIPNRFVVKQGVPVEWRIDAEQAIGCGRILIAPRLRVQKLLRPFGTNVISFTPEEPGEIYFNCGMGMMTPGSKFTVVPNTRS